MTYINLLLLVTFISAFIEKMYQFYKYRKEGKMGKTYQEKITIAGTNYLIKVNQIMQTIFIYKCETILHRKCVFCTQYQDNNFIEKILEWYNEMQKEVIQCNS